MDDTSQDLNIKAFKVILVGMQAVGKSSILCQVINSNFPSAYQATVGIDYHTYSTVQNGKTFSLQIWDTAGQQKFRALTGAYFRNCSACLCVYDVGDKQSVEKVDYYLSKAQEQKIPQFCTFMVGNKIDLLSVEELENSEIVKMAQEKAEKYGIKHRLVSAKTGKGVTQLFDELSKNLADHYQTNQKQSYIHLLPNLRIIQNRQNCKC